MNRQAERATTKPKMVVAFIVRFTGGWRIFRAYLFPTLPAYGEYYGLVKESDLSD